MKHTHLKDVQNFTAIVKLSHVGEPLHSYRILTN